MASPSIKTSYILHLRLLVEKQKEKVSSQLECHGMKPSREDLLKMSPAITFIFFLCQNRGINNFVFWADNCSGQNKNWFLYTALVNEVNRINRTTNEVTIKYFEPRHTFVSADSFHHVIEQAMRKKQGIEDFQDFVDLVDFSGKALVMEHDDFLQITRDVSQAKYASKKPKLEVIQVVQFERGSNEMH